MRALLLRRTLAIRRPTAPLWQDIVLGGRRFASETAPGAPGVGAKWPLALGGALSLSVLAAGLALKSDGTLRSLHSGLTSAAHAKYGFTSICVASALAQLPIDELKLALLRLGAFEYWAQVLERGREDNANESSALSSMVALLSGDDPLDAFYHRPDLYHRGVAALSAMPAEAVDTSLLEVFDVAASLASHPAFLLPSAGAADQRFWEVLLESGVESMQGTPAAAPAWSCIAARAAQRPDLVQAMIGSSLVKRKLMELAEGKPIGSGFSEDILKAIELQQDYAVAALHAMALAAEEAHLEPIALGWGRRLGDYLEVQPPYFFPPRPPPRDVITARPVMTVTLCGLGGLAWGCCRCVSSRARAARAAWQTVLATSCGAAAYQSFMEAKHAAHAKYWLRADEAGDSANYAGVLGASAILAADIAVSFATLQILLRPALAPYAFGGWLLGQLTYISSLSL